MPPSPREKLQLQSVGATGVLDETDSIPEKFPEETFIPDNRPVQIVWKNVAVFTFLHLFALYGLILVFTSAKWQTTVYAFLMYQVCGFGITGGAHRLWAHRAYKAKWPLKLILVFCQTLSHQNSVIEWARDHRVHHKFQETDADPHNAKRGFFFSHIGWLLCKKHNEVKAKGKGIDVSDLYAEPLLRLQHKYFKFLMPVICFVLPTVTPMLLWGETFMNSYSLNILRYMISLHSAWMVNSAAHMWGAKPYDKYINPTENLFVTVFAMGEGWHNYHHTFPWDYKAAEFGKLNISLIIINLFAKIGWAYDLKTVSEDMMKTRIFRTGDGSHELWGWGDKDQTKEDYEATVILNRKED